MQDYRVQLEAYSGPLDLLLYLVKRHEIDLHDIPIARLTEQYLEHLKVIEQLDMDTAGEFLVMAATLLEIKSQMLMPRVAQDEAGDGGDTDGANDTGVTSGGDPRLELVQQLLAYKRFRDAARQLEQRQTDWAGRFQVHAELKPSEAGDEGSEAAARDIDLEDLNVLDLCEAFSRILDSIGRTTHHEVTYDDTPISLHAADIYDRLQREGPMSLQAMFEGRQNRSEMIGLFLATLELVREHKIRVVQDRIAGQITLEAQSEDEREADSVGNDEASGWRDPETGEMQYDWPDEATRKRAERRAQRRAAWAQGKAAAEAEAGGDDADDEDLDADDDAG